MAAKPSDAKTTIDSLAELLRERGKMELSKIAQTLGVEQNVVENWAKVLEAGNMVKISYEVGKMYVEPLLVTKEQETAVAALIDAQRAKLENDVAQQKTSLDRYTAKLEAISLSVKSADTMFREKFPEIEMQLEGINKIYAALEEEGKKVDDIRKHADTTYIDVNKKVSVLSSKVEGEDSDSLESARDEMQKIRDVLKKAGELENQLTLLSKSKDRALETVRKSIEDQLKLLEKDLGKASQNISQQLKKDEDQIHQSLKVIREQAKTIDEYSRQINSFGRDKESVRKALKDTRDNFNNEYSKISIKMENMSTSLKTRIKEMLAELDKLKANFGEIDKLYDTLQKSKTELDELQARVQQIRKDAEDATDEVKALQTLKGSIETRSTATQKVSDKVSGIANAAAKVDSDIDKITKDLED
jgi:chromosome segregation ATPase